MKRTANQRRLPTLVLALLLAPAASADPAPSTQPQLDGAARKEGLPYVERIGEILRKAHLPAKPQDDARWTAEIPMAYIPPGKFRMGSPATEPGHEPSESPARTVEISAFWMASTEITRDAYLTWYRRWERINAARAGDAQPVEATPEGRAGLRAPDRPYVDPGMERRLPDMAPILGVTPYAAQEFCRWLSLRTGRTYRLPTEAEWEYAARAGTATAWHFGDDPARLKDYACFAPADGDPHAVAQKRPNPWGLFDTYGNASEWVLDRWSPDYRDLAAAAPPKNPWLPRRKAEGYGVIRGGNYASLAEETRSASRAMRYTGAGLFGDISEYWNVTDGGALVGFRIVSPVAPEHDGRAAALEPLGLEN